MATQPFPVVQSRLDLRGAAFQANRESWKPVLDRFEAVLRDVCSEGSEASLSRHQERGQLLGMYLLPILRVDFNANCWLLTDLCCQRETESHCCLIQIRHSSNSGRSRASV